MTPAPEKFSVRGLVALSLMMFFWMFLGWPQARTPSLSAQERNSPANSTESPRRLVVPRGTILPVVLRTTISAGKTKPGQTIHGQIAQDVPLPDGSKIHKGSRVEGKVVEVGPDGNGSGQRISLRFDKLYWNGKIIPVATSLRAIAGFMEVLAAGTPAQGVGESDVFNWMTTTQIGGDSVYGRGGTVTGAHSGGLVVGTAPISGGVLVQVSANPSGDCRGAIDDNDSPQALWVFSSDACGTYGLPGVHIVNAGRTQPAGTFTLRVDGGRTKIHEGDGLLLRVIG